MNKSGSLWFVHIIASLDSDKKLIIMKLKDLVLYHHSYEPLPYSVSILSHYKSNFLGPTFFLCLYIELRLSLLPDILIHHENRPKFV